MVSPATLRRYKIPFDKCIELVNTIGVSIADNTVLDESLCRYVNEL